MTKYKQTFSQRKADSRGLRSITKKNSSSSPWFKIFGLVLIIGLVYVFVFKPDNFTDKANTVFNSEKNEEVQIEYKDYYLVPVSKFTNTKTNYTFEELKTQKLITPEENIKLIPDQLTNQVEMRLIASPDEDEASLPADGEIFLLTPDQVTAKYKTIYLDGQSFWAKDFDEENWPLKKNLQVNEDLTDTNQEFDRSQTHTFFATGEIIPARAVDRLGMNKYGNHSYMFDFFREDIQTADLSIGLLENSLLGDPTPCTGCMSFRGDDKVAPALGEAGFDILSTAGNHAGDAGQEAYRNTLTLLDANNVQTTGTGNMNSSPTKLPKSDTNKSVLEPGIKEINGLRVGMISADDVAGYFWKSEDDPNFYGTNHFSKRSPENYFSIDEARIAEIQNIKTEYNIDYLIVFMSWGVEYTNKATGHQQNLGHALIDNGADIIVSSHPHWVQNIEFYNGKAIIYSLGNFLFDQTHTLPTRQGAVTNLHYYKGELKNIDIIPLQTCGYHQTSNDLAPKYLSGEIELEELYSIPESKGCIYWQPRKLRENESGYQQILERMFEHTNIEIDN